MKDCETFIRGTIRFKGFSYITSGFHDLGLTSELPVPLTVKTWRDFAESLLGDADINKCHPCVDDVLSKIMMGVSPEDTFFIKRFLSKMDISYIDGTKEIREAYKSMIRSIKFFGFLDDPK